VNSNDSEGLNGLRKAEWVGFGAELEEDLNFKGRN